MKFFDSLPPCHHTRATSKSDLISPHLVHIAMIDRANVLSMGRKGNEVVPGRLVIVIGHRIGESADNGFSNVCIVSKWE